jgi:hypothetical protein
MSNELPARAAITLEKLPGIPAAPVGPFTVDWLREKIQARGCCIPPDCKLARLAALLNRLYARYKNSANLMLASSARVALWVLARFFDERRQACEKAGIDPQIVESERRLCDQGDSLVEAMFTHTYALDMDEGAVMRPYETWRDFAIFPVAWAFKMAMEVSNPGKTGFTSEGPIAWLTNEAIGVITGKKPGVPLVGQHLKQPYKRKRR